MARTAKITREGSGNWDNVHRTVRQDYDRLVIIDPPFPPNGNTILDDMKATTEALKIVLGEARDEGKRLRGLGGGWSLSSAAITDGWLLSTLAFQFPVQFMDAHTALHKAQPRDISAVPILI